MRRWNGLIEEYKEWLPVTENTPALTLQEGNTPLIYLENLSKQWGINLYVKTEGTNPTGSFKDRGMVMAVAKAKEEGKTALICASTGNTSAAAAAYGARAGMRTIVVIPEGRIALGKLAQAKMYGAEIVAIEGNFDEALRMVRELGEGKIALVNSVNPYRLEGQKTVAFETIEQLGKVPDIFALPVGNAGNISAAWKGFKEYAEKKGTDTPKLLGVQADGAAPIVYDRVFEEPETVATAIRIGNPASWHLATQALEESGGDILSATDEEILEAYQLLAATDGIFAEPASCATIAGIKKRLDAGLIEKGTTIVGILTGNGLKDPETAINVNAHKPMMTNEQFDNFLKELKEGNN
ncbi:MULTISPECIES: threonine synthase [unclassified Sporosarcina]|uniref:threonine synthase n=1 Tax=unclassified Sporosarcina TaxID=2647733 RepID=UPI000C163097|nr:MULTISPECIES: threonine synthase [unclassified Sporosarcina]PIC85034.1 threonine synthase [Sporosarcina sp. P20a]PIC97961.1 threonine synthase [Sporosarcina sp. P29]PID04400.1 threonine synthase [Sporosarcina sp. P30]PID07543.1 threonine synthase [Sporosarcina sp. P31]PID10750.1 threonine synthase [Sporosarcina sp. P32b]